MFNYPLYRWCKRVDNESHEPAPQRVAGLLLDLVKLFDFDTQEPWHKGCDGQCSQDTGDAAADD